MEKLKSIIPWKLEKSIQESTTNDLPSTCFTLHRFFSQSPLFHSMIQDLTNTQLGYFVKNKDTALELKSKANDSFSAQHYSQALNFYSQALRVAPVDAVDKDNKLVATLYVNRASSLHKMNLFDESIRDCNRALLISPSYAKIKLLHRYDTSLEEFLVFTRLLTLQELDIKAWYRRGKVKMSLLNYEESISDLRVAMKMEGSLSGRRQIESDIKLIANKNGSSTGIGVQNLPLIGIRLSMFDPPLPHHLQKSSGHWGNNLVVGGGVEVALLMQDEVPHSKIQCVTTPTKGRGMASLLDIPPASLLHREEPYAAIILKKCRETHCHFCFNELPADTVPCPMCSMPLYCSDDCLLQARGEMSRKCFTHNKTDDLQSCFSEVTLQSHSNCEVKFTEHGHECHGVNWPTVLPSEVVLAGRILVKLLESKEHSHNAKKLDLSHNYGELLPEGKVELHVYSIVLLYCLHYSYGPKVELDGAYIPKIIVVICQVKINSMAIVRMKYQDKYRRFYQESKLPPGDAVTSHLEQVRAGQAVYLSGSLFNHSCVPNIHAYFISRTLLIRATEFVHTGHPLEMSYGPEVGKSGYRQRLQFLQDNYSFKCQCNGCMLVNFPDLVLDGFHCANSDCRGVVLDPSTAESERNKTRQLQRIPEANVLMRRSQVDELKNDGIRDIASLLFKQSKNSKIQSGCCLKCGSAIDLKSVHDKVQVTEAAIQSLQVAVHSDKVHDVCLSDALCHFEVLKTVLHPYNKKLAQAHDILAEAFCSDGQTQRALDHCFMSIEILKKIYGDGHIALGNELMKLSSLQLAITDTHAADTVNQMDTIFSNYYGRHAERMFPYLEHLKGEVDSLSSYGKADFAS